MAIAADKAYLIGFGLEAILYGFYLILFGFAITFLVWRKRTAAVNKMLLFLTCLLFIGSTVHISLIFSNVVTLFVSLRDQPGGPTAVLQANPTFDLGDNIAFIINNLLGDIVLIYRCWLVWQKNVYVILVPVALLLLYVASAAVGMTELGLLASGRFQFPIAMSRFGQAFFSVSLALNILVISLIAGRIWYHLRQHGRVMDKRYEQKYTDVIAIIIESGAVICIMQAVFVVAWATGNQASVVLVASPTAQIYCIVPTLIIVRVGLGLATTEPVPRHSYSDRTMGKTTSPRGVSVAFVSNPRSSISPSSSGDVTELGGVAVKSETLVHDA